MDASTIERELHIEASPEIVYEVVSSPDHVRQWWPDDAAFEPVPGGTGTVAFGEAKVVALTVVEADPPRRFAFRWTHEEGETATSTNSLLVTFELVPSGGGTLLRFTETYFRERGWGEQEYRDHATGWDHFLPRLGTYVARLVSAP